MAKLEKLNLSLTIALCFINDRALEFSYRLGGLFSDLYYDRHNNIYYALSDHGPGGGTIMFFDQTYRSDSAKPNIITIYANIK